MTSPELPVFPADRDARCPFDPAPEYQEWREGSGLRKVNWQGRVMWAVSRHEDVRVVTTDPRISARVAPQPGIAELNGGKLPKIFPRMDDPEHAVLRRMLTKDFTVKRVNALRPEIEKMANEFIDAMVAGGGPADLVPAYALPIPSLVICLLLGVPYADREFFQGTTAVTMRRNATVEEKQESLGKILGYLSELVARKETEPDDALIGRLVREYLPTGELARETIAMNSMILLSAGHETTSNMIALGTLALLQNPDTLARVRDTDDPKVVSGAVEELLRYLTIAHSLVVRVAKEDIEIGGTLVHAGEGLILNLPAANRDPAFLEDADTLDIDRSTRGHMAFGYGVHQCLGQTLARAELEIALPTLLRRLPNLRLAVPLEEIRFKGDMNVYGVHELPVEW
ncbi:cytochrome P450 [Nocardia vinacea]|uniref:Cytochrome P450 n=1 Tax=Nocardia vinacea TaxID=96468 RepID=A0ABZ1YJ31_9NOCA|nr:cytochrome P450 [Nocardia vinacea]